METSVPNVYAAGDCVEVTNAVTGDITLSPLGTTAVRQGIILAKNLAGHEIEFQPVLNSTVSQIGGMEMGAVGITQQEAEKLGIPVVVSTIESLSRARYYPGSKPLYLKLIAKTDGTIIGCQMFGQEAVAERVDTMTAIMSQKLTCDDVVSMEFSYAPPVSQVIDPIAKAAEECLEKIDALDEECGCDVEEKPEAPVEETTEEEVKEEPVEEVEETTESTEETSEEGTTNEEPKEKEMTFPEYLRSQGLI
jgi:NADH oxidase (H2O2-forming)